MNKHVYSCGATLFVVVAGTSYFFSKKIGASALVGLVAVAATWAIVDYMAPALVGMAATDTGGTISDPPDQSGSSPFDIN